MSLTPSQRIALIREIGKRLGSEEYFLIDLTLKQFGMPWANEWNGTKDRYVLEMIQAESDHALIGLAQHLGFNLEKSPTSSIEPAFWRKGMLRLFISHLASKKAYASDLQDELLQYGISAFVAHNDIKPTLEWQSQIETALSTCDALTALLHDKFHESKWTDQEIGFAMGRGVAVSSVRFGQDPYGFIGRFQAFNGTNTEPSKLASELFAAYQKDKLTQKRMGEVLVGMFEESNTFAEAKARVEYLEDLGIWEPTFSARIESAANNNSQIKHSWGVSDRVKALVKKWAGV